MSLLAFRDTVTVRVAAESSRTTSAIRPMADHSWISLKFVTRIAVMKSGGGWGWACAVMDVNFYRLGLRSWGVLIVRIDEFFEFTIS